MGRMIPTRKPIVIWSPQDCEDLRKRLNLVLERQEPIEQPTGESEAEWSLWGGDEK